jgi:hypothetical protein
MSRKTLGNHRQDVADRGEAVKKRRSVHALEYGQKTGGLRSRNGGRHGDMRNVWCPQGLGFPAFNAEQAGDCAGGKNIDKKN